MKRITCRLAQRKITPAGWLANHIGGCEECQSYFDRVRSLEEELRTPPEEPDEELAQSIMAMIESGEQGPAVSPAFTIPIRRWVVTSGLAATATGLNEVRGIAMRPDGSFFVCTHRASQLWFIDTQGLIWLAIDGNRNSGTHAGDGEPLTPVKLQISEPRAGPRRRGDLCRGEADVGE
mgnify:CR=1 FL=1